MNENDKQWLLDLTSDWLQNGPGSIEQRMAQLEQLVGANQFPQVAISYRATIN